MSNSSSECNFTDIDRLARSLRLGISIPTFILGLVLNSLALSVFCCCWKKQTKTSVYMINLALADFLLLLSLPLKLYYSIVEAPGLLCSFIESLYFINTYSSIFITACITADRYLCIRHPFQGRANQSPKGAVMICCFIWAVSWLCSSSLYTFHKANSFTCFSNMAEQVWSIPLIVSVEVFGFLIPLTVMVFCSAQTIWILLSHEGRATKRAVGGGGTSRVIVTGGTSPVIVTGGTSRVIVANLVVFLVCFTPFHLAICLQCLVRQHVIEECKLKQTISLFIQVAMLVANLNCCLDAIFYYFAAREFRDRTHLKKVIEGCSALKPRAR